MAKDPTPISWRAAGMSLCECNYLEYLPQAAVVIDTGGTLVHANRHAALLLGCTTRLAGTRSAVFFPRGFKNEAMEDMLHDCASFPGKVRQVSLPARRLDGSLFQVGIRLSALLDGTEWRLLALLEDDSAKRSLSRQLSQAVAKAGEVRQARRILDNVSESFCIVDAGWIIRYWNPAAAMATGKGGEAVLGKHMWEVFPQEESSTLLEMCNRSMHERISTSFEHSSTEGTCFYNAVHPNENGGITIYFKNISARKNREREREMLVKELTRSNSDLLQFSFITSHNLRAPLSNILGLMQLLDRNSLNSETLRIADMIAQSAGKLSDTINDLSQMLVIKNSSGVGAIWLSIEQVFAKAKKNFADAEGIGFQISTDLQAGAVFFNEAYLESIFVNLVSNAIKYRERSRSLEIWIRSFRSDGCVVIEFADNGTGIDMRRHGSRLFGMYQRFHASSEGQGLGLFIVKSQIDALGGSIEASSQVGSGTVFRMDFPDPRGGPDEVKHS